MSRKSSHSEIFQPITMADVLAEPKYGDKIRRWMAGERVDDAAVYYNHQCVEAPDLFSFSTDWGTVRVQSTRIGRGYYCSCKAGSETVPDRITAVYKLACTIWNLNARGVII